MSSIKLAAASFACTVLVGLGGCATPATPEQQAAADTGAAECVTGTRTCRNGAPSTRTVKSTSGETLRRDGGLTPVVIDPKKGM
jgi:hypothetical protein